MKSSVGWDKYQINSNNNIFHRLIELNLLYQK